MNKLKSLLCEENAYTIAIRERKERLLFESGGGTDEFITLPVSSRIWYADPLVFSYQGRDYLFCEIYNRETDLGSIGVTEITSTRIKPPHEVLNIGTHLSYPCVFEFKKEIYMIPETTTRRNLMLFRATHFPDRWELVGELLREGEWADTTVYTASGSTIVLAFEQFQGNGSITKIHVYDGSQLPDRLTDYPSEFFDFNSQCRGAGYLFPYKDLLIRPSQDCTADYGYALRFNKVTIAPTYSEELYSEVKPEQICCDLSQKVIGIHTYCLTERFEIIDVKFNNPVFRHQVRRVVRYFARKLGHR